MPDQISCNRELGIIEVQSYGVVTGGDLSASIEEVKRIRADTGIDKLLIDTRSQQAMPNPVDILDIVSNLIREIRTAFLLDDAQRTAKDIEFVETVGVNRGKVMKLFRDREQALEWLNAD